MNLKHLELVGISVFMTWAHLNPFVDIDLQACVFVLMTEQNSIDGLQRTASYLNSDYQAVCKY